MVCGHLLETRNTNSPLRSNKIFCPNDKPIEDQKKIFATIHREFPPNFHWRPKKRSSPEFEGIFPEIFMEAQKRDFFVQCPVAPGWKPLV